MTLPQTESTQALSIERWSATSGSERGSRASLVLHGGGHRWRAHAEGNGAIDALMRAVDDALAPLLGEGVVLTTFDVHAAGPGHETKGSVSLSIRSRADDNGPLYPGRFVSENVLEASVGAYVDAVNALLADAGVDIASAVPTPGSTDTHDTDPEHRSGAKDRIMSAYNG
ncbi:MAG: alpha-isopropylmalate synthase regulatory domain-containing protein [Chloroflexota bacterium]